MFSILLPALPVDRMDAYGGGRHFFGGFLLLLLVAAAVALLIVMLVRKPSGWSAHPAAPPPAPPASPTAKAEAIVAERLARGEISPDDYRATLAALRADHSAQSGI